VAKNPATKKAVKKLKKAGMKKTSEVIDTVIANLRKCGLEIPRQITARGIFKFQCKEEFVDAESGEPLENIVDLVMYSVSAEYDMTNKSVPVGSRGCHTDYECIYGDGDYADLVMRFASLAGQESQISGLRDWVDVSRGEVFLKFNFKGKEHYFKPKVDRDWADDAVVLAVMKLFAKKGYAFYLLPYGQPGVFYFLRDAVAKRIRKLYPGAL
jgi:hypothetical protein